MTYDEIAGGVQHRFELPGTGETVRAIRATLTTPGPRIREAKDLAGSLPVEIGWYPVGPVEGHCERFDWREFVARVAGIEKVDPPESAYYAHVVVNLVNAAASPSTIRKLRDQFPRSEDVVDLRHLSAGIDAGGWQEHAGPRTEALADPPSRTTTEGS